MREIPPGQPMPLLGTCKRTGKLNFTARQYYVRFPVWLHYRTLYSIHADESVTGWWVRLVSISLDRYVGAPGLSLRVMWGEVPVFQMPKSFTSKPLNCDDCR